MPGNTTTIRAVLERQRERLLDLIEKIDDKNLAKEVYNQELRLRRRYYQLKNNGRGRPALKYKRVSHEDEIRRVKYDLECNFLGVALRKEFADKAAFCTWLKYRQTLVAGTDLSPEDQRGQAIIQTKIARLLKQFSPPVPFDLSPPDQGVPKRWAEAEIRDHITLLRIREKISLGRYQRRPARALAERDEHDAVRARFQLYDRFVTSNHLATAQKFFFVAGLLQVEIVRPPSIANRTVYDRAWIKALDELQNDLKARFVPAVSSSPACAM